MFNHKILKGYSSYIQQTIINRSHIANQCTPSEKSLIKTIAILCGILKDIHGIFSINHSPFFIYGSSRATSSPTTSRFNNFLVTYMPFALFPIFDCIRDSRYTININIRPCPPIHVTWSSKRRIEKDRRGRTSSLRERRSALMISRNSTQ